MHPRKTMLGKIRKSRCSSFKKKLVTKAKSSNTRLCFTLGVLIFFSITPRDFLSLLFKALFICFPIFKIHWNNLDLVS